MEKLKKNDLLLSDSFHLKDYETPINMKSFFLILIGILLLSSSPASCQLDSTNVQHALLDTLQEGSGLFDSNELLQISLRFNITEYKRKRSDVDYLDAIMTYHISETDSINKEVKVKSRGEFRRNYCNFPPLLLNFKMKDTIGQEFSRIDKLKMVTHCRPGTEENLFREFLIYKLYSALTENSFRVRLLKVNYINTFKKSKVESEYAFVIEPIDLLAKRIDAIEVETRLTQKNIKPEMMDRMAIFNYMIGNPDWSVPIQHNIKTLVQASSAQPNLGVIVPYDFDISGLVNTKYAIPFEGLRIKTVRERIYLGICREEQVFINALNEFSDKQEEFYKIINEFPYLKEKSKERMISYLEEYFRDLEKPDILVKVFRRDCIDF